MHILGLNAYHADASACLLRDGALVAATEEERFWRVKHWAGFPSEAVQYCLDEAGITLDDIDHVAINQDSSANLWRKIAYLLTSRPDLSLLLDRVRNKREKASVPDQLNALFPSCTFRGAVHHVEHHFAHLASTFLVSPFEEAVVLSLDGFGDFASAEWGVGTGSNIDVDGQVYFPHSLGLFYQAMTQYLGFPCYGDEYKVMGLAPYGEPKYLDRMRRIVNLDADGRYRLSLDFFVHHKEKITVERAGAALAGVNVRVCLFGTPEDQAPVSRPPLAGPPTLLLLGRADELFAKGHDILIEIWPDVLSVVPKARLLLVGGGSALGWVRDLASASPARHAIEVAGFVPDDDLDSCWRRATAFAMPGFAEGFGLVYAEAMRYSLPVVASTDDGAQAVNVDGVTGFNVARADKRRLMEVVIALLSDHDYARVRGTAAHARWRERYSLSSFRTRLLSATSDFLRASHD